jgi:fumarylpyruvate hydrolase
MTAYLFPPPEIASLSVRGISQRFAVNRIFCVGRNYHAHAAEMGRSVDKSVDPAFYFTKSPQTLTPSGATVPYPPGTQNYHYEMELVVAIGKPGFRVTEADAHQLVYGYASGLDMTRRDLQLFAREKGRPWDLGKDFEESAVCSEIVPMPGIALEHAEISLQVNGSTRQRSIWPRKRSPMPTPSAAPAMRPGISAITSSWPLWATTPSCGFSVVKA